MRHRRVAFYDDYCRDWRAEYGYRALFLALTDPRIMKKVKEDVEKVKIANNAYNRRIYRQKTKAVAL